MNIMKKNLPNSSLESDADDKFNKFTAIISLRTGWTVTQNCVVICAHVTQFYLRCPTAVLRLNVRSALTSELGNTWNPRSFHNSMRTREVEKNTAK
jgi:hypothetical protein